MEYCVPVGVFLVSMPTLFSHSEILQRSKVCSHDYHVISANISGIGSHHLTLSDGETFPKRSQTHECLFVQMSSMVAVELPVFVKRLLFSVGPAGLSF